MGYAFTVLEEAFANACSVSLPSLTSVECEPLEGQLLAVGCSKLVSLLPSSQSAYGRQDLQASGDLISEEAWEAQEDQSRLSESLSWPLGTYSYKDSSNQQGRPRKVKIRSIGRKN